MGQAINTMVPLVVLCLVTRLAFMVVGGKLIDRIDLLTHNTNKKCKQLFDQDVQNKLYGHNFLQLI